MLDFDLANLYQVETKRLKEAVRRNKKRFPEDFMFELSKAEYEELKRHYPAFNPEINRESATGAGSLRSQFATLKNPVAADGGRLQKEAGIQNTCLLLLQSME